VAFFARRQQELFAHHVALLSRGAAGSGHLTTANAKFYKQELQKLLEAASKRGM
jgi:hypothetical protein